MFLILLSGITVNAQMVVNGSLNGGPIGNSRADNATGWTKCAASPDLCDVTFRSYVTGSQVAASPSPDGGNWLGLAGINASSGECAQTTITGLTAGQPYTLCFYSANFGTGTSIFNAPVANPEICVGGTCQTYSVPMAANTWTQFSLNFTATATTMILKCQAYQTGSNQTTGYACLDGFVVGPPGSCGIVPTGAFGDSICNGEQAIPYATGGVTYSWTELANPATVLSTNDTLFINPTVTTQYEVDIDGVKDTVDVIVSGLYNDTTANTICETDSLLFEGRYYKIAGFYRDTLTTINGCDSILNLDLTVFKSSNDTLLSEICEGDSLLFIGTYYKTAGFYRDTLSTANGCDSILNLDLKVNFSSSDTVDAIICKVDSVWFRGNFYKNSGVYRDTIPTVKGCDSIAILNLTVSAYSQSVIYDTICEGTPYMFGGVNLTATGTYYDTIPIMGKCDSLVTLEFHVNPVYNDTTTTTICDGDSVLFESLYYKAAGYYTTTYQSSKGCDSNLVLSLTIEAPPTLNITGNVLVCNDVDARLVADGNYHSILWNTSETSRSIPWTSSGTYIATVSSVNNCTTTDSIEVLREICIDTNSIFIPNSFTPNNDFNNDIFQFNVNFEAYTWLRFSIYDRWGNKIYQSEDGNIGWDGQQANGDEAPIGVYIWLIEYKRKDQVETVSYNGHVTLLR